MLSTQHSDAQSFTWQDMKISRTKYNSKKKQIEKLHQAD